MKHETGSNYTSAFDLNVEFTVLDGGSRTVQNSDPHLKTATYREIIKKKKPLQDMIFIFPLSSTLRFKTSDH